MNTRRRKRARPDDPRLAAEQRALRLGRWCRSALEVSAGVGYSAFLLVQAKLSAHDPSGAGIPQWIAVGALIGLPLFPATLERALGHLPSFGRTASRYAWIVQALPLLLLDLGQPAHLVLGPLALLQGNLLVRSGDDKLASWSLALGPVQVLCGMAMEPSPEWLLLFPLSMLAATAALTLLLARSVEEDVIERAPRVLLRYTERADRRGAREWTARLARALPLSALVLLAVVPLYVLVSWSRAPFEKLWNSGADARLRELQDLRRNQLDPEDREHSSTSDAIRKFFPDNLTYGGGGRQLQHRAVMEVTPLLSDGQRRPRALYMRGLVLDEFGVASADFGGGIPLESYRSAEDGWTPLMRDPPEELLHLGVLLEPLFIGDTWSNVLFGPHPIAAVDKAMVRYHPDDRLSLPVAPQETIAYELLVPMPQANLLRGIGKLASHSNARYTALPAGGETSRWIASQAREVVRGARDDGERVRRVLDHFHSGYAYSLDAHNPPGLEGVVEFLQRRQGHCTSFAVAAVLMLRSLNIPARVATGYLASDWLEDEELFRVTTRNGHAWIEVHFEDRGWVTLDPTPPERRAAALAAAAAEAEPSLGGWFRELRENAVFWSSTGGHDSYLRGFFATLVRGPAVLLSIARRSPGPTALVLLALVLAWAWRRSRRTLPDEAEAGTHLPAELVGPYRRLMRALGSRGYCRRPAQTLAEFARATQRTGGELFAPLGAHVAVLYRARFGERPVSTEEARALDEFVAVLERAEESTSAPLR